MSAVDSREFCDHCGLSVGRWSHSSAARGDDNIFCCYGCFVGWQAARGGGDDAIAVGFLIRLGVGAFLSMNIMLFSLLLYSGTFDALEASIEGWVHWLLWALSTPALLILGGPFFREAATALLRGQLVPATLIVMGTSAAYGYSTYAAFVGLDRVYFDTAAMVLMLFTLGRYLEANGRAKAARSLRPMLEAERQFVTRTLGDTTTSVPLAEITAGMLIQVEPGMRIPVDGRVREGESQADESTLTGEPHPADKEPGSSVWAGTLNGDQRLLIEAEADGLQSRWIQICRDVRAALARPTRLQRIAERAAVTFIPLVMSMATLAVWLNWDSEQAGGALLAGVAVLVVACPCALGLAAPLATSLAIVRLVEQGIVLRNGAALETLANLRSVLFDKTGTLTQGHIRCIDIESSDPACSREHVLARASAVALGSRHPLSLSVLRAACNSDIHVAPADNIQIVPGMGVRGVVQGETVQLGNARWFQKQGIPVVHTVMDMAAEAGKRGHMVSFLAMGGVCRTILTFAVESHPESRRIINALEQAHVHVGVLTGDGAAQAGRFCASIGVDDWQAELTPEDKHQRVLKQASKRGPVAMVGDGVNDAMALTAADVGIAVGNATDLTRETADVVLHSHDVAQLLPLLSIARTTRRTIVTNLLWAFGYNLVAIALATGGTLSPILAAALMAGSSLAVVSNTLWRLNSGGQTASVDGRSSVRSQATVGSV